MAENKFAKRSTEELDLMYKMQEPGPLKDELAREILRRVKSKSA